MPDPILPVFELVGDADAGVCVDGVCTIPGAVEPDDAESR
jgi:hypothetical protein